MSAAVSAPILMVAQLDPWGETIGARLRLRFTYEALSTLAPVQLVVVSYEDGMSDPLASRPSRSLLAADGRSRFTLGRRLGWAVTGSVPLELLGRDHRSLRDRLATWLEDRYALVWVVRSETFHAVSPVLPDAPVVVDLDDLEADKRADQLRHGFGRPPRRAADRLVFEARRLQARRNVAAWRRFDRRVVDVADAVVLCSDGDVETLGAARGAVVPNGYPLPPRPLGRTEVAGEPTLLLQGALAYGPNLDAARHLVDDILPLVRREVPEVRLRLVGRAGEEAERLHDPPHVVVTGFVDDLDEELSRADLVVVPIRYGGGTRIKVLEAFAHRIPVVATPVGAHGLGVEHDRQLLLADDPAAFAQAIVRSLGDVALRRRLADEGRAHVERHFTADVAVRRIRELATSLAPGLRDGPSTTG